MTPQSDEVPAGRFMLNKTYEGDLIGKASGQMISKRIEGGAAIYFAIEEFAGTVGGKKGAFTLAHKGFMNGDTQTLEIAILEGSGTEDLANINGTLNINQSDGSHFYELNYQL
ncbi:DUF3224 domain-containing protein [Ekhidna sp.]|uniref:DUF3224 domain-containing protein n=1 Tax=Ekhidna sp. TaxID=2608089 RepID=UPI003299B29C